MRPLRNIFYKLSRTEQRREGVAAYLWLSLLHSSIVKPTKYTESGNVHFLASIPSCWKNQPSLVRVGVHAHPLLLVYQHGQSWESSHTLPISTLSLYVLCGNTKGCWVTNPFQLPSFDTYTHRAIYCKFGVLFRINIFHLALYREEIFSMCTPKKLHFRVQKSVELFCIVYLIFLAIHFP